MGQMGRFLFTTLPSNDLGLLAQSLPIAAELRSRGHDITFCSPGHAPKRLIAAAGFDNLLPAHASYYFISGDIKSFEAMSRLVRSPHPLRDLRILLSFIRHVNRASTAEIWDFDHFMYLFGMGDARFVDANVDSIMEMILKNEPDAVVDFWNPFACIAARACGKPLITVIQADNHPASRGFMWWRDTPPVAFPSPVPATNSVLEKHHLPAIRKVSELLVGDLTLVVGIPEADPLPSSSGATYVGPLLWEKTDERLPDWINHLGKEMPLIWLYPGNLQYVKGARTFGDSEAVLQACIDALGSKAVQVVLSTGHQTLPHRFDTLPPNFRHAPYVAGLAMARRSDLLIHHGGYGSCQTGLSAGKPALIIPTYSERESNARRVAALGAGDYILPAMDVTGKYKQVSAQEVETKVFKILSDGSFAARAQRISERMSMYGGAPTAADHIERLVVASSGTPAVR
ncbi:MAG: glycosyltransferase [Desulfobacteraceae bacterium]|nr:MAG: glycosyltransferase [Desulfobacteraceae bacterium]